MLRTAIDCISHTEYILIKKISVQFIIFFNTTNECSLLLSKLEQ